MKKKFVIFVLVAVVAVGLVCATGTVGFCKGATIGSTSWTPTGLYNG